MLRFNITPLPGKPLLKLPADFKAQWLAALRSGNYQQTDCYLHTADGYCCLGVACDIGSTVWEQTSLRHLNVAIFSTLHGSSNMPRHGDLPQDVFDVLHQPTDFEDYYPDTDCDSDLVENADGNSVPSVMAALAAANDDRMSFADIADWIEANL